MTRIGELNLLIVSLTPKSSECRLLDLSHCLLNKLNRPNFMLVEFLEVLQLNDNRFRRLDKRVFVPLRHLKSLTMENNPWLCDCRLQVPHGFVNTTACSWDSIV